MQLLYDAGSPQGGCIAIVCTNFAAALVVEEMDQELGQPIFDGVVVIWKALGVVGLHTSISGWYTLWRRLLEL